MLVLLSSQRVNIRDGVPGVKSYSYFGKACTRRAVFPGPVSGLEHGGAQNACTEIRKVLDVFRADSDPERRPMIFSSLASEP